MRPLRRDVSITVPMAGAGALRAAEERLAQIRLANGVVNDAVQTALGTAFAFDDP